MNKIKILPDRIIINGHADTREQCETATMLANLLLAQGSGFDCVEYRSGYAEFKKSDVAKLADNELKFIGAPAIVTINWDSNITKVIGKGLGRGGTDITFVNGQSGGHSADDGIDYTFEVTLNSGYVLDTVTLSDSSGTSGTLKSQTDTSFVITAGSGGIYQTITLTSKVAKIQTADRLKSIKTHIQEAYTALENKSATIPTNKNIENLKTTIESVSTGIDTSDATATDSDILSPKTAYARGEKLTGGITVYDGAIEDVDVIYTDCLTFTGETSEFTLKAVAKRWDGTLYYSTDYATWEEWDGTTISSANKKLYLRGKGNTKFYSSGYTHNGVELKLSANASCSGNIQTLLDWENPPTSINADYCYRDMFDSCTHLTAAPELPATTLSKSCYEGMFDGCTGLITAPALLPATTLANRCYYSMFRSCQSLISAPELPATTLADECYEYMFNGCTSLASAPELPATSLADSCYVYMFAYCTNLTTPPILPATRLASGCYINMFNSCKSLKATPALPATALAEHCYFGMFRDCTNLTIAPRLPATTLVNSCYGYMFNGCSKLKVNSSSGTKIFTCPSGRPFNAIDGMFANTGGSFTGSPAGGTTYYYTL